MTSEEASTLALAPMVRFFTYAVIKSMKNQNLEHRKYTVHTDMVPKVTQHVIDASLGERISIPEHLQAPLVEMPSNSDMVQSFDSLEPEPQVGQVMDNSPSIQSSAPVMNHIESNPIAPDVTRPIPSSIQNNPINPPIQNMPGQQGFSDQGSGDELSLFYGKITPLLNDPHVSSIECHGSGEPLLVSRDGQSSPSKIVLSGKEIEQILNKISEAAHIPIMEGVFRAAVDNFSVNAVVSEMIGSRFVIRKQPASPQGPPMGRMGGMPPAPGFR